MRFLVECLWVQSHVRTMTVHRLWWTAGCLGGARGWNADQFGRRFLPAPSTAREGVEGSGWGAGVVGTLLGPEGTGNRCFWSGAFLVSHRSVCSSSRWLAGVVGRGLVGSCGGLLVGR